jgi:hypothetical protein
MQQVHQLSQRRVARLIPIERMTLRYLHHRDPQEALRVRCACWPGAVCATVTGD